jgi:hypothetical protein
MNQNLSEHAAGYFPAVQQLLACNLLTNLFKSGGELILLS